MFNDFLIIYNDDDLKYMYGLISPSIFLKKIMLSKIT